MAKKRRPKGEPWPRKSTGTYYLTIDGHQYPLGTSDPHEAKIKAAELKRQLGQERTAEKLLLPILDEFLVHIHATRAPATAREHLRYLRRWSESLPRGLTVDALTPRHFTRWLEQQTTLGPAGKRNATVAAKFALNWAVEQGMIDRNPLALLRAPTAPRREIYLTAEQLEALIKAATPAAKPLLEFLFLTGCRPIEARKVEARHVREAGKLVYFPAPEAKGKRHPRRIFVPECLRESLLRRTEVRPAGPLFLNSRGKPWTKNALVLAVRRARAKAGLPDAVAYLLRHSFATRYLDEGQSILKLQMLLGHTSVTTTQRYQHLPEDWREE